MTLSEELQRIADEAPAVPVSPDTWARARSARRRDRSLVVAAAAAVVAVVATATLVLPGSSTSPQPAAPAEGGLRIDYVSGPGTDLPVRAGAATAAYVNDDGAVVLLGADGDDRRLDLPGRAGPVALSPDGTKLAFGSVLGGQGRLEVVDLAEGEISSVDTRRLVTVERLTWGQRGDILLAVGRDATGTTLVERLRDGASVTNGVDVGADARVVLTTNEVPVEVSADTVSMLRISRDARPLDTIDTSASGPVIGACAHGFTVTVLRDSPRDLTASSYDVRQNRLIEAARALPDGGYRRDLSVLGCLEGPDPLLADRLLVRSGDDLAVLTVGGAPSYDVVGSVDPDVADLSVATDLVD